MIPFVKMHGAGNDFVCLDLISPVDTVAAVRECDGYADLSREICDRNFGVGSDGILVIERGDLAPFRMRMFNPDGSEAQMCGNGTRCVGRFVVDHAYAPPGPLDLEVFGRVVVMNIADNEVSVDMGPAVIGERDIELGFQSYRGTTVNVGNPHVVVFVEDLTAIPLAKHGRAVETLALFPEGANVHFARRIGPREVEVLHWERGAGATLACGSGACAVAAALLDGPGLATVKVPGGTLHVEIDDRGHAIKTGPAETVFSGEWPRP